MKAAFSNSGFLNVNHLLPCDSKLNIFGMRMKQEDEHEDFISSFEVHCLTFARCPNVFPGIFFCLLSLSFLLDFSEKLYYFHLCKITLRLNCSPALSERLNHQLFALILLTIDVWTWPTINWQYIACLVPNVS